MSRSKRRSDRGQVFMMFALLIPVLAGMVGMAVDLGSWASDRRSLQNAADSIALAAGQELPDAAKAQSAAQTYATKNGIALSDLQVTVSGGTTAPKVSVTLSRSHDFAFLRLLGVNSGDVGAKAATIKASFGGGSGIVPWAVTQATVDAAGNGTQITMKYDSTGGNQGNFGAIRIDGSGASTYLNDVSYGSTTYACAVTAPNCTTGACPGSYPNVCSETAPQCDGPDCNPENGNMTGPTRNGTDFRMSHTNVGCDTFAEAFPTQKADGTYQLSPDCNPWTYGAGYCANVTSVCSRRVIIIPVVNGFGNGQTTVTIQRFALVYLEGYTGSCTGNSCDILGRFVQADVNTNALAGTYDPTALVHYVKLTE